MSSLGFEGQKVHGTFREQFTQLQISLEEAIGQGAATPEEYKATLLQILKSIEALRIKNESALMKLKEQEAQYIAMVRSCSMLGSLLINIVDARTREHTKIREGNLDNERRFVEELKGQVEELKAAGKESEAIELQIEIDRREADLKAQDEMAEGSRKESEITAQAVMKTFVGADSQMQRPLFESPPNPHESTQPSRNPIQEVNLTELVQESLNEVPVNEVNVISKGGNGDTRKRKFPPKRK